MIFIQTHQRGFVITVKDVDEICNGQHSCSSNIQKKKVIASKWDTIVSFGR